MSALRLSVVEFSRPLSGDAPATIVLTGPDASDPSIEADIVGWEATYTYGEKSEMWVVTSARYVAADDVLVCDAARASRGGRG